MVPTFCSALRLTVGFARTMSNVNGVSKLSYFRFHDAYSFGEFDFAYSLRL